MSIPVSSKLHLKNQSTFFQGVWLKRNQKYLSDYA